MNKKLIVSLIVIAAAAAVIIGGTIAFFSDVKTSSGNRFVTGSLDLKVDSQCKYNGVVQDFCTWLDPKSLADNDLFFNFNDVKPGDNGEDTISLQVDDNDSYVCAQISNLQSEENGCLSSEQIAEPNCQADNVGELQNNIFFTVWKDNGAGDHSCNNVLDDDEQVLVDNQPMADNYWPIADSSTGGALAGKTKSCFGVGWNIPSETGNEIQTDKLSADISFYAIQSRNIPQYLCGAGEACVPQREVCADQKDNDCDGYIDCGDSDCANDSACQPANDDVTIRLENKNVGDSQWPVIDDGTYGELTYNPSGPTFDYSFKGYGLNPGTSYSLIYYADSYPGNHPGAFLGKGISDGSGSLNLSDNLELNMNLPDSADGNYPTGAKIWLVLSNDYNEGTKGMAGWHPGSYLLETQWVNYTDTDLVHAETISLNDLGADPQYGYTHDYSGANVTFAYDTPATDRITGTVTATGLKPYETYQLKFEGKPACIYGALGDDAMNEQIGYMGRWWDNTSNSNGTDSGYLSNSIYHGGTHCITGYLVWGYITADENGDATKVVTADSSYHVLWCSGGTCGQSNNSLLTTGIDPAHPSVYFCEPGNVNGQIERGSCGTMTFAPGDYSLNMILNEESFHQGPGTWTAVMEKGIEFKIE
jgi:predicted ribosomally synthesized peptide with SipW-like signal peptide